MWRKMMKLTQESKKKKSPNHRYLPDLERNQFILQQKKNRLQKQYLQEVQQTGFWAIDRVGKKKGDINDIVRKTYF